MSLSRAVPVPPPTPFSTETLARVAALLVATLWFDVLHDAARHASATSLPHWLAALTGLATQLAFTAAEAALAVVAWGATGTPVTWRALAPRLLAVSSAEALALAIAAGHTSLPPVLAVGLAGARAGSGFTPGSGPEFAFAAFGALAVARLLLSAHAQARVARASYPRALLVVAAFYLATRLVMWWSFDLMQGRSFQSLGEIAWPDRASNA